MKISLVAADLTKWVAFGTCQVTGIWGFNQQTTDRYVLFFEKVTPVANDVPVCKGLNFPASTSASYGTNAFGGGLSLSELCIAISTEPQKLTAPGAGGGLELTVEIETNYPVRSGITTIAGDLTTPVASLQVWAESAGPKKLVRLDVVNNAGMAGFVVIQASDAALTTDSNSIVLKIEDAPDVIQPFSFNAYPFRNDAGTFRQGCIVRIDISSATDATLPFVFTATTDFLIRAIYE